MQDKLLLTTKTKGILMMGISHKAMVRFQGEMMTKGEVIRRIALANPTLRQIEIIHKVRATGIKMVPNYIRKVIKDTLEKPNQIINPPVVRDSELDGVLALKKAVNILGIGMVKEILSIYNG
jgi:hypothetical protein